MHRFKGKGKFIQFPLDTQLADASLDGNLPQRWVFASNAPTTSTLASRLNSSKVISKIFWI